MADDWPSSPQNPLGWGPIIACGYTDDALTGGVTMPVYGNGLFRFNFTLPSEQDSIKVAVAALVQGNPPNSLNFELYSGNTLLASGSVAASQLGATPAWTPFVTLTPSSPPLSSGTYTLYVSTSGGDSSNYYWVFMNFYGPNWQDLSSTCGYTMPSGWTGSTQANGWSVIWVQDAGGNDLEILPYGNSTLDPGSTMSWTAASSYQINFIAPWLSDMEYVAPAQGGPKGYTGTWTITDTTTGQTLGQATSTQWYNSHGIMGVVPIQLPNPINIVEGHDYEVSLSEPSDWYLILLRGSTADPAKGSLTGNSPYWWGQVGLADFSAYRVLDSSPHILSPDGIGTSGGAGLIAVRFVPSYDETLTSVSIKMYDGNGTAGNYPSGVSIVAAVFASNEATSTQAGAQPTGSALASESTDSGNCPYNGFLTIGGFSYSLTAGTPYWIVWSAPSASTGYGPQRNVSPFRDLLQVSHTGISGTWEYPGQGPSDLAWYGLTSKEILGSPLDITVSQDIDAGTNLVAQPFSLSSAASVTAVYAASSGNVQATIYPDDGSGTGPDMGSPLGSGSFNSNYQYFYGGVVIPLGSPVFCAASVKYWIVFQAETSTGTVSVAEYWTRPSDPSVPSGYEARTSSNGGSSWSLITADPMGDAIAAASTVFMVGTQAGTSVVTSTLVDHGVTKKGFVPYGQPFTSATTIGGVSATQYYKSLGFLEFPWQDGSTGYSSDLAELVDQYQAIGGGVFGPLYGWGYATQFYNLGDGYMAALYPNEQEYYLSSGALSPAQSYGYNGIVIDAPELVTAWLGLYSTIDSNVGLSNLLGTAGWLQSDHPVNYGGAQGADGGHNMNTYVRYVNSPLALYQQDVNSSGYHVSDDSQCLLWPLKGASAGFSGQTTVSLSGSWPSTSYSGGIIPTVELASDVSSYHHQGSQTTSFALYCASANAALEYALLQRVLDANVTQAIGRTAMPSDVLSLVPQYNNAVLELMQGSGSSYLAGAFGGIQATGGANVVSPYFNWANASDDSSNPGGGYGVATAATTLAFFVDNVPYLSHLPYIEVDTDTADIQSQASSTSWSHFGPLYNQIQVDGWFGYVQDKVRTLVVDHFYDNGTCWSALGLVCHAWGTDSYSTISGWDLSGFDVVVGCPNATQDPDYSQDLAQLEAYVSAGGNLILYTNGTAPSSLTGIGSTATAIHYDSSQTTYPFLSPYAASDLQTAFSGASGIVGYLNSYGSGRVLTLTGQFFGDGFGVGDSAGDENTCDSLSGGLAYLTLNAILWLGGQATPAIYLPRYVQRTSWAVPLTSSGEGGYSGVGVHVLGFYNGQKSVWLSSDKTSSQEVAVNLSSSFYGFPSSWKLTDLNTGTVAQGDGDVELSLDVPSSDWMVMTSQAPPPPPPASTPSQVIIVE